MKPRIKKLLRVNQKFEAIAKKYSVLDKGWKWAEYPEHFQRLARQMRRALGGFYPGETFIDIGTGPGFLLASAKALGAICIGTDVAFSPIFEELRKANEVKEIVFRYRSTPTKPIPFGNWDKIAATRIQFGENWTGVEWAVFASTIRHFLRKRGRAIFRFTKNTGTDQAIYAVKEAGFQQLKEGKIDRSGLLYGLELDDSRDPIQNDRLATIC